MNNKNCMAKIYNLYNEFMKYMTYKHFRLIYNAKFSYNNHFQKLMVSIRRKNACGKRHTYEGIDFFYFKEASKIRQYRGRSTTSRLYV